MVKSLHTKPTSTLTHMSVSSLPSPYTLLVKSLSLLTHMLVLILMSLPLLSTLLLYLTLSPLGTTPLGHTVTLLSSFSP